VWRRCERAAWTRRQSARRGHGPDDGGGRRGGGAGAQREASDGWGGGRRGTDMELAVVEEAFGDVPTAVDVIEERAGAWVAVK
jgi:hypothetical protein